MPQEIERKYLLQGDGWRELATGSLYRQGYIRTQDGVTVRVRVVSEQGYLTIKGPSVQCSRLEFEYLIPLEEAEQMLDTLCMEPLIEKTRYKVPWAGLTWEIDEFAGANQGLILAEVELSDVNQDIQLPPWIGQEVSHEPKYYNSNLVDNPFSIW